MLRTRVGYTGGEHERPTYHDLGDHTEAIQIDFDPEVISYEELLGIFWGEHDPCASAWSVQYRNAVWVEDERQRRIAEKTLDELPFDRARVVTPILEKKPFYRAEDYHQKYVLRRARSIAAELERIYPETDAFADSTAAARLNGYLGGHGTADQFEREVEDLGLSGRAIEELRERVRGRLSTARGSTSHR